MDMAETTTIIPVAGGKGGVGKSHVTAALALAAAERLKGVGVLDADLRSPTVARMLGASGPLSVTETGVEPVVGKGGVRVFSTDFLLDEGRPLAFREPSAEQFVWRGVLETGTLREFLSDVNWGALDVLLVDLPPGADGVMDLHALVPSLAGAVVITIPSEESRRSVSRAMRSATDAGIPLLGVIENMSGYRCGDCHSTGRLFAGDAGQQLADEFKIPLLARLPFDANGGPLPSAAASAFLDVLR